MCGFVQMAVRMKENQKCLLNSRLYRWSSFIMDHLFVVFVFHLSPSRRSHPSLHSNNSLTALQVQNCECPGLERRALPCSCVSEKGERAGHSKRSVFSPLFARHSAFLGDPDLSEKVRLTPPYYCSRSIAGRPPTLPKSRRNSARPSFKVNRCHLAATVRRKGKVKPRTESSSNEDAIPNKASLCLVRTRGSVL